MGTTKEEIISSLQCVGRIPAGFITYLCDETDFFTAPASTKYHGNYSGGLADHSLNVYDSICLLNDSYMEPPGIEKDSLIITALLHDICKVNYYVEDDEPATKAQMNKLSELTNDIPPEKQRTKAFISKLIDWLINKKGECPQFSQAWKVEDTLPLGHGEKSLYLLQKHIDLTDEEAIAIRWHLGANDPGTHFFFPSGAPNRESIEKYPLVALLHSADYLATWLVDVKR